MSSDHSPDGISQNEITVFLHISTNNINIAICSIHIIWFYSFIQLYGRIQVKRTRKITLSSNFSLLLFVFFSTKNPQYKHVWKRKTYVRPLLSSSFLQLNFDFVALSTWISLFVILEMVPNIISTIFLIRWSFSVVHTCATSCELFNFIISSRFFSAFVSNLELNCKKSASSQYQSRALHY